MQDLDPNAVIPVQIEHRVEEIRDGDVLEQRYNFLDYHFELMDVYFRARTYLDEPSVAALFGPFAQRGAVSKVAAPAAEAAVLTYLHHRFATVQRM
jgi:hypothetical protein